MGECWLEYNKLSRKRLEAEHKPLTGLGEAKVGAKENGLRKHSRPIVFKVWSQGQQYQQCLRNLLSIFWGQVGYMLKSANYYLGFQLEPMKDHSLETRAKKMRSDHVKAEPQLLVSSFSTRLRQCLLSLWAKCKSKPSQIIPRIFHFMQCPACNKKWTGITEQRAKWPNNRN